MYKVDLFLFGSVEAHTMTITTAYKCPLNPDYVVVRIRSDEPAPSRPLHIGILIDTSGSMEGERMIAVKRTLHAARSLWTPTDKCTLVGFSETATIYQSACTMDEAGATAFYVSVDSMSAMGCTNLSAGLSALYSCSPSYDGVILLTDGVVNRGVSSIQGLQALCGSRQVIHALGYGADHSRTLLRKIATAGRGSYTYVDSDEILPLAIGNIMSDARGEVLRDISILVSPSWTSAEPATNPLSSKYHVGNIISGRDYWCVFRGEGECVVKCLVGGDVHESVEVQAPPVAAEVQEQIMRARVATLLEKTTTAIEEQRRIPQEEIAALLTELDGLSPPLRSRPLILTFIAQLTEASTTTTATPHAAARVAAATTILTTQRGIYSTVIEDPAALYTFCSPVQRATSQTVHNAYM
jgi:hypothetical protein